jgi:polyene macrolide polyketide synthase
MSESERSLEYLRRVTVELQAARRRLDELHEPVAIVGMACRYPGDVDTAEDLWQLVRDGCDAISGLPTNRGWDLERLYDPDPDHPGTSYVRHGGFLHDAADFDAGFFEISPREALAMDPQQRLALEVSWEALEHAGVDPRELAGSAAGVFTGVCHHEYLLGASSAGAEVEGHLVTGLAASAVSGRVAHILGLEGPAVTIDTACSSSLVALHLAVQALRSRECGLALAGGVAVLAGTGMFVDFSRQRGLAPDGRCKSYSSSADGTSWSEGVGVLVLERLSDARHNGHEVLAVIRGSAVNQDGASNGLTAPNGPSQQRVIRMALSDAGLSESDVDAVDGHGTGTSLGDPIEAGALLATYGRARSAERPVWLGSVKSNIGHAQAAAGIAGVIKMVMALRNGLLPRSLHIEEPSPEVNWSEGAVELLVEDVPWPSREQEPRRAAVSSFGISGTNAHVILEEAPTGRPVQASEAEASEAGACRDLAPAIGLLTEKRVPWVVSGRGAEALRSQAGRMREWLAGGEREALDVGSSLARRSAFEDRAVIVGEDLAELAAGLGAVAGDAPHPGVARGVAASQPGRVGFVFPGQGAQWVGMGRELLEASALFAECVAECAGAFGPFVDWSLIDVLAGREEGLLDRVDVVQPVLFAVMVGLARLWRACGVSPDVVVGHSQGEIAAVCVAGGLSLGDAARLVCLRSRALRAIAGRGGMASVALDEQRLSEWLAGFDGALSLAAVNGPGSMVVSGDPDALAELIGRCEAEGVKGREIPVDYAAHSAHVEALRTELLEACEPIEPCSGDVSFYSSVTGGLLDMGELDGEYWYRNLRETVRFDQATRAVLDAGCHTFIEISPHPVLSVGVQETIEHAEGALEDGEGTLAAGSPRGTGAGVVGSLRRDDGGPGRFLLSLGEAWVRGASVDWQALFEESGAKRVPLPPYAFQRERYWLSPSRTSGDPSSVGLGSAEHPLLGAVAMLAEHDGWLFTGRLSLEEHGWLADHAVLGNVLVPGTVLLDLALHACERTGAAMVGELTLHTPLVLEEGTAVQLQVTVAAAADGVHALSIHSRPEPSEGETGEWVQHATGALLVEADRDAGVDTQLDGAWPPAGAEPVAIDDLYERLEEIGLEYGPAFQRVTGAWHDGKRLFAEVQEEPDSPLPAGGFAVNPALLDACLHPLVLSGEGQLSLRLPFSWSNVRPGATGPRSWRAALTVEDDETVSLTAVDESGATVVTVGGLASREVSPEELAKAGGRAAERSLYRVEWRPCALADLEPDDSPPVEWALLGLDGVSALPEAVEQGAEAPAVVFVDCSGEDVSRSESDEDLPEAIGERAARVMQIVQEWLAHESVLGSSMLVAVTQQAVAVGPGEDVAGLADAPVWGLLRSAQAESPGRLALLDIESGAPSADVMRQTAQAILMGEPQLALRDGVLYAARLQRAPEALLGLPGAPWRVAPDDGGTLERLAIVPAAEKELGRGLVRVGVRAAGLNFRDVLNGLGVLPLLGESLGGEGAGVVLEVGEDVGDLAPGDRVMGMFLDAFASETVVDRRLIAPVPQSWTFAQAAAMPVAFLTAYHALVDLGRVEVGERVLVHSAAGGVGMAAVQIARWLGAEVLATASPGKWDSLRRIGLDERRIASSRDLEFAERFAAEGGVDVVLNSLAGEAVDASLSLLGDGGRFLEMGKTDVRDPEEVARQWPGVSYTAFEIFRAGPERIQEMLVELLGLFEQGSLTHLPTRAWDVRHAAQAMRFMAQARHVGKLVLTVPGRRSTSEGATLITGGTGVLGGLIAQHLVERHGVRDLLLVSRRGADASGARELSSALQELGASVEIVACDVSDREQARRLLERFGGECRLAAVVHAAGTLDDAAFGALTPQRLRAVLAAKLDSAWHLHELTLDMDLDAFVLFSSLAGVIGAPGQANYAAANAFLDALAARRRAEGLPAVSLAWGLWEQASGLTSELRELDAARIRRSGIVPIASDEGLALLDAAWSAADPLLVPARLDMLALRPSAARGTLHPILRELVGAPAGSRTRRSGDGALLRRLSGASHADRRRIVLQAVQAEIAAVLGHSSPESVDPQRALKELGFDSLLSVELRNRLNALAGAQLPTTVVFDHPSAEQLAGRLLEELQGHRAAPMRVTHRTAASEDPVAIVGLACRYPGGVRSAHDLWQLALEERDAMSGFPADRGWDVERLYDPDGERAGTTYVREGGFVPDVGDFDAAFFGISPREARAMDPQQRLLLEVSWEALEDAGIRPDLLRQSDTGVFAGGAGHDYGQRLALMPEDYDGLLLTSNLTSVLSGRVSYTLGLEGPAISVDTACSSSLVAIHMACQALRAGECSLALAGGVTVLVSPTLFIDFARQRGLARDGRCKSFADEADGTNFGEGAGVVVLERLNDAQRLGHRILALVKGGAVNQDGASNGLTAPNGPSQQRVISQALSNAGLTAAQVSAVEAHGTGTALGDPIEAQALLATYGQDRAAPVHVGSIKSNIGHTQAAAGVAGVIKMAMAMRHGVLPKTLHADRPSSSVDWSQGAVSLLAEQTPWERNGEPRRAGVSSFGISGTNAHLILEEAPEVPQRPSAPDGERRRSPRLLAWVLSARTSEALRDQAGRLGARLAGDSQCSPLDVGLSLASLRTPFEQRAVLLGEDLAALADGLRAVCDDKRSPSVLQGARGARNGRLAYVFSGQGAQRAGMGAELYEEFPLFAEALDELCGQLDGPLGCSLRSVMFGHVEDVPAQADGGTEGGGRALGRLDDTAFAQAGLFALEVALFRLLESFGMRPDFLIGHSIGEVSAAHVAGVVSLADACALVSARGRLMSGLRRDGAMIAVQASEQEACGSLAGLEDRVAVAAVNAPGSLVLSGERSAVDRLARHWEEQGRKVKRLRVSHAFHSPCMDGMLEDFRHALAGISFQEPRVPVVSNLTGRVASAGDLRSPDYWMRHIRETVRFADGIGWLCAEGVDTFVELGPDGALTAMVEECIGHGADGPRSNAAVVTPVLRRDQDERRALLGALARAWMGGVPVEWSALFDGTGAEPVSLPTYAFQRKRYWLDPPQGDLGDPTAVGQAATGHGLLGAAISLPEGRGAVFTGRLSLSTHPWLADHAVAGMALLPASAFVELALHAGSQIGCGALEELVLQAPLALDEQAVQLRVVVGEPQDGGRRVVSVHSRPCRDAEEEPLGGAWTPHASGSVAPREGVAGDNDAQTPQAAVLQNQDGSWPAPEAQPVDLEELYDRLASGGLEYGPSFRALKSLWRRGDDLLAEVELPEGRDGEAALYGLHPALLDAALHGLGLQLPAVGDENGAQGAHLPFALRGVGLSSTGARRLRVCLTAAAEDISVLLADETGAPVGSISALSVRPVSASQLRAGRIQAGKPLFLVRWDPVERYAASAASPVAVLSRAGKCLAHALQGGERAGLAAHTASEHADLDSLIAAIESGKLTPEAVLVDLTDAEEDPARGAPGALLEDVLGLLRTWIEDERLLGVRLVLVTQGAVAAREGETPALPASAVWGMVRSAQIEHPGRLWLLDVDGNDESLRALAEAPAPHASQAALRAGSLYVPRLEPVASPPASEPAQWSEGAVLVTGGTGALGGLLARHLVAERGVRQLVLASRRGAQSPGAERLQAELCELGASVRVVACDAADARQLEGLVEEIASEHGLQAVVHAAGVLEDAVIGSVSAQQLERVLRSKLDAALNLERIVEGLRPEAFVLFSSVAATLGSPGQAAYAAANAGLDAIAARCRLHGVAATSIAWGWWDADAGMTGGLDRSDLARIRRAGMAPLAVPRALELFDLACAADRAHVVAMQLDRGALRAQARAGRLAPMLSGLVRVPAAEGARVEERSFSRRVLGAPAPARLRLATELVCAEVAEVLGHASAQAVDPQLALGELGFDSLTAVELRNRLASTAGVPLPATLVFDHPTSAALAAYLLDRIGEAHEQHAVPADGEPAQSQLDRLERTLLATQAGPERDLLTARLQRIIGQLLANGSRAGSSLSEEMESASDEEIFGLIDRELGRL